jgi:hypothetical protein
MKNQFRSPAFLKIKHSIGSATNAGHLQPCKQMLENSYSILTLDEITILKEYLDNATTLLSPLNYETELINSYKRLSA